MLLSPKNNEICQQEKSSVSVNQLSKVLSVDANTPSSEVCCLWSMSGRRCSLLGSEIRSV